MSQFNKKELRDPISCFNQLHFLCGGVLRVCLHLLGLPRLSLTWARSDHYATTWSPDSGHCHLSVDDGTGCVSCILWTNHSSFAATSAAKGLELQVRQELASGTARQVLFSLMSVDILLMIHSTLIQLIIQPFRSCNHKI